jgi:hypothetical protein
MKPKLLWEWEVTFAVSLKGGALRGILIELLHADEEQDSRRSCNGWMAYDR